MSSSTSEQKKIVRFLLIFVVRQWWTSLCIGRMRVDSALGLHYAFQVPFLRMGALEDAESLFAIANVPNICMHPRLEELRWLIIFWQAPQSTPINHGTIYTPPSNRSIIFAKWTPPSNGSRKNIQLSNFSTLCKEWASSSWQFWREGRRRPWPRACRGSGWWNGLGSLRVTQNLN